MLNYSLLELSVLEESRALEVLTLKLTEILKDKNFSKMYQFGYQFDLSESALDSILRDFKAGRLSLELAVKNLAVVIWQRAQKKSKSRES
ncbi:MAG: hypothetical protein QE271_14610 [Bacteriovoracaceae bacterium]|nr:hypothetical protein [Bacteriovoracaceae bacterium]